MFDAVILWEWLAFSVRWLHVITAMAWIGASFYFIALDLMLKPADDMPEGAAGEEWEVHGGGFYHTTKYLVAPARLPEHLTWHKWQSYSTWLSGAALLMIIYWVGGELYLIDAAKADLIYDFLCKNGLKEHPTVLMVLLFVMLVIMSWGYHQVFTGRAAMLHLGAFTATIMTANVFFIIMPNQRIVVKDLQEGRTPDAKYGKIAKLRSMHNNYLTLPVIFLMLSNHYPLAFATEYSWIIAALVFLTGVTIRHYFNTMHSTGAGPHWTWAVTVLLFVVIAWLSTANQWDSYEDAEARALTPYEETFAAAEGFDDAHRVIMGRCAMCHAREPSWSETLLWAPKGVLLFTRAYVARHARAIYVHSGVSHAMPPANVTAMSDDERAKIVRWYQNATTY